MIFRLILYFCFFFTSAFSWANQIQLKTPIALQTIKETPIYRSPSLKATQDQILDYGYELDIQTMERHGNRLWWLLKLKSGAIGYIPAENLSQIITYIPKQNESGLYNPYLMGFTHTVEFILENDTEGLFHSIALDYLEEAVALEFPTALWLKGILLRDGIDIEADVNQASSLFFRAINKGENRAYYDLAKIFEKGYPEIPQNMDRAIQMNRLASEAGDPRAKDWLVQFDIQSVQNKEETSGEDHIQALQDRSLNNDIAAMKELATEFLSPQSQYYDDRKAEALLIEAASQGDLDTMLSLAALYHMGSQTILPDPKKAFYWSQMAAKEGDPKGSFLYGNALYHGLGVDANKEEGLQWLRYSASLGYEHAIKALEDLPQ